MTLEALIAEAHALGLQFNNLIELQDGIWRCNLRERGTDICHAWARGKTPAEAIDGALRYHRAGSANKAVQGSGKEQSDMRLAKSPDESLFD